ncbi:uncharacterized protein LOC121626216 [Chelmon rostratus]|uniref:uncharacterized protein LOC121626215 n=1 Tax=Chelmon rostratus TaxID=109905 RepID=UPI001BE8D458|nr:uncharacterized protein LOC121626215 [Chelmon rostratus]XP_041820489.1 uncharacterized protein LOC121626216 [Chelmon rostratus]
MRSLALLTAFLLCRLSWISVWGSESQTVEARPDEEVTLLCSNISVHPTQTDWFRLSGRTKPHCISSMYTSDGKASLCDGIQNGKFQMSSNGSSVFLKIQPVDFSDSGLYFCGFYIGGHTVIVTATHLNVQGDGESDDEDDFNSEIEEPVGLTNLMSVSLVALTVLLTVVIIVLAGKIRNLQTAVNEEAQSERNKNLRSDNVKFLPKTTRSRRPASEGGVETHVIYAACR